MSFFDRPAPAPEPEPAAVPEWLGPPENVLGRALPHHLVLGRSEGAVVLVRNLVAYPTGVEFVLEGRRRKVNPFAFEEPLGFAHRRGGGLPDYFLRFGVQFSDGSSATNVDFHPWHGEDAARAPRLTSRGGSSGGRRSEMGYWLWPLPPSGPLEFVVAWPSEGIAEARAGMDADELRHAATEAETLWPPADDPDGGGGTFQAIGYGTGPER